MTRKIPETSLTHVVVRAARRTVSWAAVGISTLVGAGAWAAGVSGHIGPVGQSGPSGSSSPPASNEQASTDHTHRWRPGRPAPARDAAQVQGNRIEITGNTATDVSSDCERGAVSINQIDVDQRSLQGRTVIVQGRNVENVHAPCDPQTRGGKAGQPSTQINSVHIR